MNSRHLNERRYWLWVTGPAYYLQDDGSERSALEPREVFYPWWTCAKATHSGDLILLYRTSPMRDVAYLIEAGSDAYEPPKKQVKGTNWSSVCDYRTVEKFANPLSIKEMRSDPVLKGWGPLNSNFQGKAFEIPLDIWERFGALLTAQGAVSFKRGAIPEWSGQSRPEDEPRPGGGFGDPEENKCVEQMAIRYVTNWYRERQWNVTSVERDRCGYDLECTKGKQVLHVEVKGLCGELGKFIMTKGELDRADSDKRFLLWVVARATSAKPATRQYSGLEFWENFDLEPIQVWAVPKK